MFGHTICLIHPWIPSAPEWLLLGALSYCIPPTGAKVTTTKGPGVPVGRCHHSSCTIGLTSVQKTRPMAGPCPPAALTHQAELQPPARVGVAMGWGWGHGHLQLVGEPRDLMVQGLTIRFRF